MVTPCPSTFPLKVCVFWMIDSLDDEAENGYIYEVDLHYPVELHDMHDDYPLSPESLLIDQSMYSPLQGSVFLESAPQRKLTPNLNDKNESGTLQKLKIVYPIGIKDNKSASCVDI